MSRREQPDVSNLLPASEQVKLGCKQNLKYMSERNHVQVIWHVYCKHIFYKIWNIASIK